MNEPYLMGDTCGNCTDRTELFRVCNALFIDELRGRIRGTVVVFTGDSVTKNKLTGVFMELR